MPNEAMPNDGTPGGDVASEELDQARPIAVLASRLLVSAGRRRASPFRCHCTLS